MPFSKSAGKNIHKYLMGIARNLTYVSVCFSGRDWHPPIPVASFNFLMDSGRVLSTLSKLLFKEASKHKTSPAQSSHESGGFMGDSRSSLAEVLMPWSKPFLRNSISKYDIVSVSPILRHIELLLAIEVSTPFGKRTLCECPAIIAYDKHKRPFRESCSTPSMTCEGQYNMHTKRKIGNICGIRSLLARHHSHHTLACTSNALCSCPEKVPKHTLHRSLMAQDAVDFQWSGLKPLIRAV